jgi:hypothetical protein
MANVKISALPSYTGSAADLRWFVMNNSGETETFKYSGYTSGVKPTPSMTNSFMTLNYSGGSIACNYSVLFGGEDNSIASTDAAGRNTIVGGNSNSIPTGFGNGIFNGIGATINANQSTIVGAQGSITDGFGNGLFGGVGQVGGNYSVIVGGYSNTIGGIFNDRTFIGGGQNNVISYGPNSAIIAGFNNTMAGTIIGFVAGTQDNTITSAGYTYALIGGGYNTVNATNACGGNAMYSSYFCTDNTINDTSVIGSSNNWFSGSRNGNMSGYGKHNWITNSYSSTILNNPSSDVYEWFNKIDSSSGSSINYSRQSQILGGVDNTIDQVANSVILGGSGNTINGESSNIEKFNMILGGSGNTIFNSLSDQVAQTIFNSRNTTLQNGGERITAIGLSGRTINGAAVGTTFVENLYAYRQTINEAKDNGSVNSAGYYVDLREGQKQTITITGSGTNTIYFTGATTGGGLKLKIVNTSTGSVVFADGSPTVWKLPATMNPQTANGTDIYVFESFDDASLWLTSHMQNLS